MASRSPASQSFLERWARFAHRRRGRVIFAGLASIAVLLALAATMGGKFETDFTLPGSESQDARDLLTARFPLRAGDTADVVFEAPAGIAASRPQIDALLSEVKQIPGVLSVESPFDEKNQAFQAPGGTIARAVVHWAKTGHHIFHSPYR